jgi:uncharacterized protein YajQ (UPF0234 family)
VPSFDVVSRVDLQEVDNAINQTRREVEQRFDFKGTGTEVRRDDTTIHVASANDFKLKSVVEILQTKLARRQVPLKAFEYGPVEPAAGGTARQVITVQQGVPTETAREIVKLIKRGGAKVQTAIQGDQVRVSGKKKDDLQAAIAHIRAADLPVALQFVNFRD